MNRSTISMGLTAVAAILAFLGVEWLSDLPRATPTPTLRSAQAADMAQPPRRVAPMRASFAPSDSVGPCAERAGADGALTGDQIALRFFETVSPEGGHDGVTRFERRDLAGTYDVDEGGEVSIPGLGRTRVLNLPLACIETRVAAMVADKLNVEADVAARFAGRLPVLVQGVVNAPGSYDYSPGLTVRRLLARAGLSGPGRDEARQVEAYRAQRRELVIRRDGLDLTLLRLEAMLNGEWQLILDPTDEARFLRSLGLGRIDGESRLLTAEAETDGLTAEGVAARRDELANDRIIAARQLDATLASLADLTARRDLLAEELSGGCRGRCSNVRLTKQMRLDSLENRLIDLEVISQDRRQALNRAEAAIRAQADESRLRHAERRRDISARISATLEQKLGLEAQIGALDQQLAGLSADPDSLSVTIEGLLDSENGPMPAGMDSPLLPGDLVTVSLESGPADGQQASLAADPRVAEQ
ncbi:MAG: hypothetical protein ACU0DK_04310 [Pseudooceanicola sp.]